MTNQADLVARGGVLIADFIFRHECRDACDMYVQALKILDIEPVNQWTLKDAVITTILAAHKELPEHQTPPTCPICKNNRQVWINQISGNWRCHRVSCEKDIKL